MSTAAKERNHAEENAAAWLQSIEQMMQRLETAQEQAVTGPDETDAVLTEIQESPLSVQVRGGWHRPGEADTEGPYEYEILLSTGGPALRIIGQIGDHNEPSSAELQWQDWGTPWTRFPAPEATLLTFAQQFYFG